MRKINIFFYLFVIILPSAFAYAQPAATVTDNTSIVHINSGIELLEDVHHNIPPDSVLAGKGFAVLPRGIPNKNITPSAFWFRLKIRNETNLPQLLLKLSNPALDSVAYYEPTSDGSFRTYQTGISVPFAHREFMSSDYLFTVHLPPHTEKYVYLHASSCTALIMPLEVGTDHAVFAADKYKDIFWGMYIGLMIAMVLYNCFVYITTKDNSYLYYIVYAFTVLITQITISGYAFQLLWPYQLVLAKYSAFFNPVFSGIAAVLFLRHFMKTRTFFPRADKGFFVFVALYVVGMLLGFSGKYAQGLGMIDMTAGVLSLYVLAVAIAVSLKGYRPAVFFLVAWVVFLAGVFIFVFKNFGILPYNNFTVYTMPVGSAMEVLLLSFALADRINKLKKDIEESQLKEIKAVMENDRIVREQNVILEARVNERTSELKLSNDGLNKALQDLKNTQTQLVESEKMASLGQLTAGVAHEINNPVTFITSHLKPLNRDVQMLVETNEEMEKIMQEGIAIHEMQQKARAYKNDIDYEYLKTEIEQLLTGIGEGASRTAEIVHGLRIFSRLDEGDLKKVDVNEGLNATLAIVNNLFTDLISLEKNYGDLPMLECYPGKINQVFLNIISNAVHAIKRKFGDGDGGRLVITTCCDESNVYIKFWDNGEGMDESTRKKIFEPFFTTRRVGEGTGLGLSIALNVINVHNGQIHVHSEAGAGSEFIITLPLAVDGAAQKAA
jgi:signal transduction histidine kinase